MVRDLIFNTAGGMFEGQKLKAIAPSGPSGGFLPAQLKVENLPEKFVKEKLPPGTKVYDILDLPLDLNTVGALGSMLGAAFVVYGDRADIVENALNCVEFLNAAAPIANRTPPAVMMTAPMAATTRPRPRTRWRTPSPRVSPTTAYAKPSSSRLGQVASLTVTTSS
jgi:hypothetical protein